MEQEKLAASSSLERWQRSQHSRRSIMLRTAALYTTIV
jgi:hypothetical protein